MMRLLCLELPPAVLLPLMLTVQVGVLVKVCVVASSEYCLLLSNISRYASVTKKWRRHPSALQSKIFLPLW